MILFDQMDPKRVFNTTKDIVKDCAILLVDCEPMYTDPSTYMKLTRNENDANIIAEKVLERFNKISKNLEEIQHEHDIYTTFETTLHPIFEQIELKTLPYWASVSSSVPKEFIHTFSPYETVLVCGIWRERCVFQVNRLLKNEGINSYLLNSRKFTVETAILDSNESLKGVSRLFKLFLN